VEDHVKTDASLRISEIDIMGLPSIADVILPSLAIEPCRIKIGRNYQCTTAIY
jgi:hypothetical protein